MPRRCAATLPFLLRKRHPHAQLSLLSWWTRRCGGRVRSERYLSGLIGVECFIRRNISIDPSRLTQGIKCNVICGCVRFLPAFSSAQIPWGCRVWRRIRRLRWSGAIFFVLSNHGHSSRNVEWVVRQLRWLRLGGIIGCWLPKPYGNVSSLESESIVTIYGSGEATEEIVIVYFAIAPDSSIELGTAGVLFLIGLLSSDERST